MPLSTEVAKRIVETLRPHDPESWPPNMVWLDLVLYQYNADMRWLEQEAVTRAIPDWPVCRVSAITLLSPFCVGLALGYLIWGWR